MTLAHRTHLPAGASGRRLLRRAVAVAAGAFALTAGLAGAASAASVNGSTTANVQVDTAITLTGLPTAFSLEGAPGDTPSTTDVNHSAITYRVTTNGAGYSVTVQPTRFALLPASGSDYIPIGNMQVDGGSGYVALNDAAPVTVHTQAVSSAAGGDVLTTNYKVLIPFVHQDTYSATLNYVASTS